MRSCGQQGGGPQAIVPITPQLLWSQVPRSGPWGRVTRKLEGPVVPWGVSGNACGSHAQPNVTSVFAESTNVSPRTKQVRGTRCAYAICWQITWSEKIPTRWTCGAGSSCCGTAPSSPVSMVSRAGLGGAARVPAVCWAGFIPGRGPSKLPPTFSQTRWGSCPFLGLSPPIFEMELAQEYIRPRSVQIFQPSEFKCPDQRVEWGVSGGRRACCRSETELGTILPPCQLFSCCFFRQCWPWEAALILVPRFPTGIPGECAGV